MSSAAEASGDRVAATATTSEFHDADTDTDTTEQFLLLTYFLGVFNKYSLVIIKYSK